MKVLDRPFKITVCSDGFVSIMEIPSDRRLKAGLPCHSAWTMAEALTMISGVCELRPCRHGGKTGMTVEPRAPNWPHAGAVDCVLYIDDLAKLFQKFELDQQFKFTKKEGANESQGG